LDYLSKRTSTLFSTFGTLAEALVLPVSDLPVNGTFADCTQKNNEADCRAAGQPGMGLGSNV
jgi:hypothetical protein